MPEGSKLRRNMMRFQSSASFKFLLEMSDTGQGMVSIPIIPVTREVEIERIMV
jgi:hypothetical protein